MYFNIENHTYFMNSSIILWIVMAFGIIIMPFVIKIAIHFGFIDKPNERKVHQTIMPRLGGLAIYLSFILGLVLFRYLTNIFEDSVNLYYSLLVGGSIIALLGILDDKIELSAKKKLVGQIIAAGVVVVMGNQVSFVTNPFKDGMIELGMLAIPITVIWIVAITNAVNLIDGLDGLAGGVSGIAALSISIIAFLQGKNLEGYISLLLVVSLIGFLIFNFHPAKIFMGDVGSLFLGFTLAVLTLQELKTLTLFSLMVPLLFLAIPILDTLYAIIRRKLNHLPIFAPDKNHLHHRLLAKGLSQKKAVFSIYLISLSFSALGILASYIESGLVVVLVIILLLIFQKIAKDIGMIGENNK